MKREILNNGGIRIWERTPSGGDYSEFYYLGDSGDICKKEDATECRIIEYTKDGEMINEIYGIVQKTRGQSVFMCRKIPMQDIKAR